MVEEKYPEHFNVSVFGIVAPPALAQADELCVAGTETLSPVGWEEESMSVYEGGRKKSIATS